MDSENKKIQEIITRGVEDVFVKESLIKKLTSGQKLRVKLGFDPTSKYVHIGRAVSLWKLRDLQDLGHTAVFIVGDFTAMIGDPSDKLSKRPMLTKEQIKENLETYKDQIAKIIDISKAEFHYNSTWLSKLNFAEIANLAESFTVSQMIERRNFKERFEKGEEISLREFLYPLMQGYDSVMVKADIELGGFDQLFNLKAGRVMQKYYHMPEQDVMTFQMLEGTDGRKMSSSWGNVVSIVDLPKDMYGKIMSLRDDLIERYFILCTRLSLDKIKDLVSSMRDNPKELKMLLAKEIVSLYHNQDAAEKAEKYFVETFSKGSIPEDIQEIVCERGQKISDVLLQNEIISSKSDWKRLVEEGAVTILENDQKVTDVYGTIEDTVTLRVGKKRFVRLVIS